MDLNVGRRSNTASSRSGSRVGVHSSTSTVIRPVPLPSPGGLSSGSTGIVTLERGPQQPRQLNEYVDNLPTRSPQSHPTRDNGNLVEIPVHSHQPKPVIKPPTAVQAMERDLHEEDDSIICKHCGKCKCDRCREQQPLPSVWLCHKKCHLSADSVLKGGTCLFVVEACFYHAGKDYQMDADVMCTDEPCACCSQPHCVKRWMCMAALSLCLPCLCCYWPGKCAIKACTKCYNSCTNKGCKCSKSDKRLKGSQNKRLLDSDSTSSSA